MVVSPGQDPLQEEVVPGLAGGHFLQGQKSAAGCRQGAFPRICGTKILVGEEGEVLSPQVFLGYLTDGCPELAQAPSQPILLVCHEIWF